MSRNDFIKALFFSSANLLNCRYSILSAPKQIEKAAIITLMPNPLGGYEIGVYEQEG